MRLRSAWLVVDLDLVDRGRTALISLRNLRRPRISAICLLGSVACERCGRSRDYLQVLLIVLALSQ